ncbi:MAG: hypothetical protein ABI772_05915 [Bacteroidota bacterium]
MKSRHNSFLKYIACCCLFLMSTDVNAQTFTFESKSSPDLDFTFNTIDKYVNGITLSHALDLNINAIGGEWDLYIGATTTAAGSFNVISSYSNTGITPPPVSLIQARVYNSNNTPVSGSGFFPLTDVASPVYIIGSNANDPTVNCGDAVPTGTNAPGDYLADPECYKMRVDLKLVPGLSFRPGLYTLRIDFIVIADL